MWSNWSGIWINSSRLPKNKRIMIRRVENWPRKIWHFWRGWRIIGRSIRRKINRMRMRPMRHVLITFLGSFWSIWRVRSAKVARSSSRSLCLTFGLDWMNWRLMKSTARATVPSKFQHWWTISSPTSSKRCKKDTCTSATRPSSARPSTTSADGSSSNASPTSAWSSTQYDERGDCLWCSIKNDREIMRGCWLCCRVWFVFVWFRWCFCSWSWKGGWTACCCFGSWNLATCLVIFLEGAGCVIVAGIAVAVESVSLRGIDVRLLLGCPFCWWIISSIFAPFPVKKIAAPP